MDIVELIIIFVQKIFGKEVAITVSFGVCGSEHLVEVFLFGTWCVSLPVCLGWNVARWQLLQMSVWCGCAMSHRSLCVSSPE